MANKSLELIYFAETNCLHSASEDLQTLIIKEMDISKVIHFSTMELETTKFIPGDNLIPISDTFFDLIQETEDSLRFPGFLAEFSDGIQLVGDLNLSYIKANDTESLFEFFSWIFEIFHLNMSVCHNALINNPGKILTFTNENGSTQYRIIPFYSENE